MSSIFLLPFVKKENIAKDTWSFYFDRTKNPGYNFYPGQYTKIVLPIIPTDDKGSYRFFTTASSPLEKDLLMITTKISEDKSSLSDFKRALFSLKEGENVQFEGPIGGFYLQKDGFTPYVLLSGGIGITPFRSMLVYCVERELSIPLTLIASFSHAEGAIFKKELEEAQKKSQNIRVVYSFEKLSESVIRQQVKNILNSTYMVSGPPKMIDITVESLENMGVEEKKIKTDIFTGY